jgi:tRNA-specific adenosine deaminase 3
MEAIEDVAASERERRRRIAEEAGSDPIPPRSALPYLCTTYDVYTFREPCIMCAMGLVHSRVARVFFVKSFAELDEPRSSGYMGEIKVHALKGTNHRYKVYQCLDLDV